MPARLLSLYGDRRFAEDALEARSANVLYRRGPTVCAAAYGKSNEFGAWSDNHDAEYTKYVAVHPEPRSTLADVVDHAEHIRKVAGVDHVGLGSDFYDSKTDMAIGLEDTSRYPYLFAEGGLRFAGKVRAGFVPHLRREVFKALKPLHVDECPFVDLPNPKASRWGGGVTADEMREMQWVRPELVAQVRFVEWTAEGRLTHAAFLGLRSDKSAHEVRRE